MTPRTVRLLEDIVLPLLVGITIGCLLKQLL
jgi:hypothetical protein